MTDIYQPLRPLKIAVIREEFISLTGDLEKSVLLNQLIYWTKRVHDFDQMLIEEERTKERDDKNLTINPRHGWIFRTASELLEETMLNCSDSTVRRKLRELIDKGWVEERQNPDNRWDRRRQFRCNLVKLQTDLLELGFCLQGFPLSLKKPQKTASVVGDDSNSHFNRSNEHSERSYKDKEITLEITSSSLSPSLTVLKVGEEEKKLNQFSEEKKEDLLSLIDQAMGIWNRLIHEGKELTRLSPLLRKRLQHLLEKTFQDDLRLWQSFCEKIVSNSFLMGGGEKGWRVSLEWIVEGTHASDVIRGKYWSKTSPNAQEFIRPVQPPKIDREEFQQELRMRCEKQSSDRRWTDICLDLAQRVGVDKFKSWFWNLASICFEGGVLKLNAPSAFHKSTLQQRFYQDLNAVIRLFRLEKIEIGVVQGGKNNA